MSEIRDPDVQMLASLSQTISTDYITDAPDPWEGSPFAWIRTRQSRQVGAIGEKLMAGWCAAKGCDVMRSNTTDYDRIVNGHRVEIKFSTLWTSGVYKFQQIRDQDYDHMMCIGISPWDASLWVLPKSVLLEKVIGTMGQHTGASGTDTAWLSFPATEPLEWMKPYGGRLSAAWEVIESLGMGEF